MSHVADSPKKSPFRPHFRAFYPHPAHGSSLRVSRGSCGMPSLRRCPLANWPRISVGNWAPPPKERKEPPTFWHPGNVVGLFRLPIHCSPATRHYHTLSTAKIGFVLLLDPALIRPKLQS